MKHVLHLLQFLNVQANSLLSVSALVLGIVNGLFLLKFYLRDRPKLKVKPLSPETYQWWFRMPADQHDGSETRRYGFLSYVGVVNKGLRKTELDSWWLRFKTKGQGKHCLKPINMPELKTTVGKLDKFYPVLGQEGVYCDGSTLAEPGCSITGMAFFEYECYGGESWSPVIQDGKIVATFAAKSVFGQTCRCVIEFSEKSWDEVKVMAQGIHLTSRSQKNSSSSN
jgi:hypothetical protein